MGTSLNLKGKQKQKFSKGQNNVYIAGAWRYIDLVIILVNDRK